MTGHRSVTESEVEQVPEFKRWIRVSDLKTALPRQQQSLVEPFQREFISVENAPYLSVIIAVFLSVLALQLARLLNQTKWIHAKAVDIANILGHWKISEVERFGFTSLTNNQDYRLRLPGTRFAPAQATGARFINSLFRHRLPHRMQLTLPNGARTELHRTDLPGNRARSLCRCARP